MASTASTMQALGSEAPAFTLPNTHAASGGPTVSLADYVNHKALLIAFICNHCPYVIHIRDAFNAFAKEYAPLGLATVAISANDASTHPDDAPEMMSKEAERYGFAFPYLYDEDQSVAKAYRAACTPDFFLFDAKTTCPVHIFQLAGSIDQLGPEGKYEIRLIKKLNPKSAMLRANNDGQRCHIDSEMPSSHRLEKR